MRSILKGLLCNLRTRRWLNANGVHIVAANFYSVIPSCEEIAGSYEYRDGPPPYNDPRVFDLPVIDATLGALTPYAAEFDPPAEGDAEHPRGFFWNNPAFTFADAMSTYAFIRQRKPALVLEIGSGFSTLASSAAIARNIEEGAEGRIICIEPYPKAWLREIPHVEEVIARPAQELDADWFNRILDDGDLLFIDSTHVVKTGSDCAHLYLRVLPFLRHRLLLHAHDIFLPYGYPRDWVEERSIHWNEQYILYALLLGNPSFRVLFGSNLLRHHRPNELERFMHGRSQARGGSLWFDHNPSAVAAPRSEA